MTLLASLWDAFVLLRASSGGVARTSLIHRLQSWKPPASMIAILYV